MSFRRIWRTSQYGVGKERKSTLKILHKFGKKDKKVGKREEEYTEDSPLIRKNG